MPGAEVFISYRREYVGVAGRISDWLGQHFGAGGVFMDVTGIGGGQEFPEVISRAIRDCRAVVAVITPGWGDGLGDGEDWVRRELCEALAAERPIVPVLLHNAPPLAKADLPEDLARLADRQAMVLSDSYFRDDVGRLIEALERLGAEPPVERPFAEIAERARAEARAAWIAGVDREASLGRLVVALSGHGIRIVGDEGGVLVLKGGSKVRTRALGGFFVGKAALPSTGRLRIHDRGATASVEVLLEEDLGTGAFSGMGSRYEAAFEKVLAELRRATERPTGPIA